MKIGTWNVRGLLEESKLEDIAQDLNNYKLDILTIQETHIKGTSKKSIGKNYTLYHTGPTTHSHHGVGIIVKNQFIGKFKVINDRICQIEIDTNNKNKLTVISAYAPTLTNSIKDPTLADNFYNTLQDTVNLIPNRNYIFIGIDSNAQLGTGKENIYPNSVGNFGKGHLNSNGERLGQFLTNNNFIATNTLFDHKLQHRVTWHHPNQNPNFIDKRTGQIRRNPIRNQIDFIITQNKLKTTLKDSRSYSGTQTESDHNLVICKVNELKPYIVYKGNKKVIPKINLENFKNDKLKAKFQEEITKKLTEEDNIENKQIDWPNLTDTLKDTAKIY